ncbi:alpha/beta fold hydrolase [Kineococcus rhizosphaerae]|uniref:Pimeloyl-ACP methyl ester carboxylesterase n=1 Tax=Kineococcus rhizosphaerae TaxID=559628 RepID=A0A2T0R8B9_9ACTN|nr:alpha/beta hydrolase [Kineococcus rhizosphaerae]PRY17419.1 pimeloyl-ACP methyl ester carboxylesterase [Kineococcus rhizosphaerae]
MTRTVERTELELPDGRTLGIHDTGGAGDVVLWHGGTPNTGEPPAPWRETDTRWIGVDRPGFGRSPRLPGRRVADVAADVRAVLDHLGVETCRSVGHSGGGSHALACAALLPERTTSALSISGLAPFSGADWFEGMGPHSRASLGRATGGRRAKEQFEAAGGSGGVDFTDDDWATLEGPWGWFGTVVAEATADGRGGVVDDDVAHVNPWGFDPAAITVPVTLVHGEADRVVPLAHARRLAALIPGADLVTVPGAGHLSVLEEISR